METLLISDLARNITTNASILATRFSGKRFWSAIETRLLDFERGEVVHLSFDDIEVMDASFADEVFGRLAVLRARKEYPYCYVILTDMNATCEENLDMALVTRVDREPDHKPHLRNCVLTYMKNDQLALAGKFENHVRESFSLLNSKREITARDLADARDVSLNAASTRLKTVADLGLAKRVEIRDTQGKQFIYMALA